MILKYKSIFFIFLFISASFIFAKGAKAATLMLIAEKQTVKMGEEVSVNVKIDDENESINAAQATVQFPAAIFEVTKIDKTGSVFNFWVEEPTFSNETGEAKFMGGASKGVSGKSLQILTLKLKARGSGSAEIILSDAVVTASDGKGTNILSKTEGTTIIVGTEATTLPSAPAGGLPPVQTAAQPQKIERVATTATKLPAPPKVEVPLYPDISKWYNHVGEVIALWDLPPDVIQVATRLSQSRDLLPGVKEQELLTGKKFGILKEGIWFIRVQFKNNIGWGEPSYYKISLDTTPPLPFEVKIDNLASDNPSPKISFDARDAFSSISHALIFIDGNEVSNTTTTTAILPVQSPGTHTVLVRIFDQAGNSVEDDQKFEILPLPEPIIEFTSGSISQGELVFISGTAIPNAFVDVMATDALQREIFKSTAQSDSSGNWKITIDKVLAVGKYAITAQARDQLGALSLTTSGKFFKVRPKIVFSFGNFINLGWFEIFIIAMLLLATGVGICAWWYVAKKNTREAYRIIAGRDIEKLSAMLSGYLKELEGQEKSSGPVRSANMAMLTGRMKETIAKMKKYVIDEEINKLK